MKKKVLGLLLVVLLAVTSLVYAGGRFGWSSAETFDIFRSMIFRDAENNTAILTLETAGVTVAGTTTLTGAATLSSTLGVAGAATLTGGSKTLMISHPADDATITLLAADSGKLHIIPDLDADTVFTMPTAAAGLTYTVIYGGVAADAHDWQFDTGADANFYLGGFVELDTSGDTVVLEAGDGDSNSIMNIFTPAGGTLIKFYCDGTNWILGGVVHSDTADGVTWADQS